MLELRDFLKTIGTQAIPHGYNTLFEHLCGVSAILEELERPKETCLAGLFHVVFGADCYADLDLSLGRPEIQELLGPDVESLIYHYSCVDARSLMLAMRLQNFRLILNRRTGAPFSIAENLFREMLWIFFANFLEQERTRPQILIPAIEALLIPPDYVAWRNLARYLGPMAEKTMEL